MSIDFTENTPPETESITKSLLQAFAIPAAICAVGTVLFWSLPVNAQSLDCAKAVETVEFAICNDESLIVLDERMEKAFVTNYVSAAPAQQKAVMKEHSNWLRERNACGGNLACIAIQYKNRLEALKKIELSSLN